MGQGPLPDLHQLPPSVFYAAQALQVLLRYSITSGLVPEWLARNEEAAWRPSRHRRRRSQIKWCRTPEDVRNFLLVEVEHAGHEELRQMELLLSKHCL